MDRESWRPTANRWAIMAVVTTATFMEVLDTTIVNVSLPHIVGSLSAGTDEGTWIITSYLLANGIVMPISGWLATVFGRKRFFMIAVGMFTLMSLCCGLAASLPQLVIFRLLQGMFGGGLQPSQQTILMDTFSRKERTLVFGVTIGTLFIGPVIGPTLGGLITSSLSWRWVFLINVPIGLLTTLLVHHLVEDPPWEKAATAKGAPPIDYIGLGLIIVSLGCFQILLDRGQEEGWFESRFICILAAISITSFVAAGAWLLERANPIIDIRALKNRNVLIGIFLLGAVVIPFYSTNILVPQLVQGQYGYTSLLAGLVVSPSGLSGLIAITIATRYSFGFDPQMRIVIGGFGLALSLFYFGTLSPQTDMFTFATMRVFLSFCGSLVLVPINVISYSTVSPEMMRDTTCLVAMSRNIVSSVGISLTTAFAAQRTQAHMAYLSQHLSPLDPGYTATSGQIMRSLQTMGVTASQLQQTADGVIYRNLLQQSVLGGYIDVFRSCGMIVIFGMLLLPFVRLPKSRAAAGR